MSDKLATCYKSKARVFGGRISLCNRANTYLTQLCIAKICSNISLHSSSILQKLIWTENFQNIQKMCFKVFARAKLGVLAALSVRQLINPSWICRHMTRFCGYSFDDFHFFKISNLIMLLQQQKYYIDYFTADNSTTIWESVADRKLI